MAKLRELFKCNVCGHIVLIVNEGAGTLVCCGQNMEHLAEKTEDQGNEKHVPIIEKADAGIIVKVGSVPHPMEEKHFINFIEVITTCGKSSIAHLKPGDKPEVKFCVPYDKVAFVREYCNLHGLWKSR
mgnify:CR=1 FL=1